MKNEKETNKGFTLVELIAIVAIIAIIFSVGSYFIGNLVNNSKEETTYLTDNNIMSSAELYVKEYSEKIIWNDQNISYIPVETLISKGYLDSNKVEDNKNSCVSITKESNTYKDIKIVDCDLANKTIVEIPKSNKYCKNIVYDGTEKTITTSPGIGYIFSNNQKTNAGSYKVIATLANKENYIWEDGTTEDKNITCSISKKNPELQLSSNGGPGVIGTTTIKFKSLEVDGTLKIKSSNKAYATATTTGNKINKGIEKNITINILATKKTNTIITFTFTPDNENYSERTITYTIGEITKVEVAVPTCNENLEYSGETIKLVKENSAYYLINNEKTSPGTYKVTANLNYGYVWKTSNNTTDENPKEIQCTIENKSNIITLDNQGATTNSVPTVLTARYNEMIPSITSIPIREYKVTYEYTVPVSASTTGGTSSAQTREVTYKYTFDGFYSGKNGTGEKYIDSTGKGIKTWDKTEDTTLYANWIKSTLTAPSVTTPTGYNKIYWTEINDSSASKITISNYHPTKDVTLYGHILDTTPPQCDYTASGTQKIVAISDWYSSNVNLKYTCSDSGSGCKTNTNAVFSASGVTLSEEKKHTYSNIYVYDNSGNKTTCPKVTIKIDKTPPTITVTKGTLTTEEKNDGHQTQADSTVEDSGSGILKVSHSSCASAGGTQYTSKYRCDYKYNKTTGVYPYTATKRLVAYLKSSVLADDNKSTEDYCNTNAGNLSSPKKKYTEDYELSWSKSQLTIFAQDAAGNITARLIKQSKSDGITSNTSVTSSFNSNGYITCEPLP